MPGTNQVLLVGDSLTGNTIRQIALEEAGYKVFPALGARAALEAAQKQGFDVAVIDGYFASSDVRDVLIGLRAIGLPTILIAPSGTSERVTSLANVHVHLTDASWLAELIPSVAREKMPSERETAMPLGFANESVRLGEHVAWLCGNQQQVEDSVRFLEVGFARGDRGIVAGDAQEHERITRILAARGVNVNALLSDNKLQLLDIGSMISLGDAWVDETHRMITNAARDVRILGCGSLRVPWPSDELFFRYEEQVERAIEGTRCVVACLYELNEVTGKQLWYGALGKHSTVVTPTGLRREQRFVEPAAD